MRRYYFGYHEFNGLKWPMVWVEENGIAIGGHPHPLKGTTIEISEELSNISLGELEKYFNNLRQSQDFPKNGMNSV